MIELTEEKRFSRRDVEELFLSVGWISGQYPRRLYRALHNSPTVVTAWDSGKLAGLARAIDDGELVAFIHYVLVRPEYQGRGIAGQMIERILKKYRDYLYINLMPEDKANAPFYEKLGFRPMANGLAMHLCNYEGKR